MSSKKMRANKYPPDVVSLKGSGILGGLFFFFFFGNDEAEALMEN